MGRWHSLFRLCTTNLLPWHRLESLCHQFKELFKAGAGEPAEIGRAGGASLISRPSPAAAFLTGSLAPALALYPA